MKTFYITLGTALALFCITSSANCNGTNDAVHQTTFLSPTYATPKSAQAPAVTYYYDDEDEDEAPKKLSFRERMRKKRAELAVMLRMARKIYPKTFWSIVGVLSAIGAGLTTWGGVKIYRHYRDTNSNSLSQRNAQPVT